MPRLLELFLRQTPASKGANHVTEQRFIRAKPSHDALGFGDASNDFRNAASNLRSRANGKLECPSGLLE
jgi:hypothetical protein